VSLKPIYYNNNPTDRDSDIRYYDTITVKHRDTKLYLHSHPEKYPLRYDDGRISSQGQQVTAYGHEDLNNQWVVLPTKSLPPSGEGRIVQNQDVVQFLHAGTNTLLMTHDVASPLMPTNQEFTTASQEAGNGERRNDTLFRIDFENGKTGDHWKSKSGWFKLIHVSTRVGLWTYKSTLPEWAFGQQEVNGKKQIEERGLTWFVNEIISDECRFFPDLIRITNFTNSVAVGRNGTALTTRDTAESEGVTEKKKKPKSLSFIRKFGELQLLMLQHNAGLTASHPYASSPLNWPFLLSGISFWTENDKKEQMYLIGNVVGWWSCVMAISVFVGIIVADLLARRRAIYPIPNCMSSPFTFYSSW
jgi:dolichyl-phosphate-mannose-protein mannosyltransferase